MSAVQAGGKRNILGPVMLVVLAAAVAGGIYWSYRDKHAEALPAPQAERLAQVRGAIGSEKLPFFSDTRVQQALARHGLQLTVEKHGSREIAALPDLKSYDFAFPAGEPAAVKIQEISGKRQSYTPFYTVMVIASWRPIAKILEANGLAREEGGHYYIVDMKGLLELSAQARRWKDLKDSQAYPVSRSVLISSTDVRKSNSAAMYLSLASYLFNDEAVVQTEAEVQAVAPKVAPLFWRQGFQDNTSLGPYDDYKTIGMGKAPMVMIYEANFIEDRIKQTPLVNADQMVLLYPRPTVYTKQVFIPLSAQGERLGALLETDPELQKLAAEYGWRTRQPQAQTEVWKARQVQAPEQLVDTINPPRFEIVESLIGAVETLKQ
ncbi:hypothetical protein [Solimonas sp. K1W22B-7]|uniref:hypothetical protein n=1 Tax=Solimonas sp. K1W22B-7 TaxID=2303331 RepID=UPI0013C442EF|nr:hypothetical protein [Solimonas sp. K1W22B-7]